MQEGPVALSTIETQVLCLSSTSIYCSLCATLLGLVWCFVLVLPVVPDFSFGFFLSLFLRILS